jgi:2-oxoglutarate ferredoxin oxidoreductase subunit alpha
MLHVSQVHPLHAEVGARLARSRRVLVVENNATGQFARLVRAETGRAGIECALKYDGMPFSVEELVAVFRDGEVVGATAARQAGAPAIKRIRL